MAIPGNEAWTLSESSHKRETYGVCTVYKICSPDDLLVNSKTFEGAMGNLEEVLEPICV